MDLFHALTNAHAHKIVVSVGSVDLFPKPSRAARTTDICQSRETVLYLSRILVNVDTLQSVSQATG